MIEEKDREILGTLTYMKKRGSLKIIVLLLAVGIILLVIGASGAIGKNKNETDGDGGQDKFDSFFEYKSAIEEEIRDMCESVSGVRCMSVVVTFDGVGESLYAQNFQKGSSEKSEYVIIGSGSGSHALYLGESLPAISGIGVVCKAAGDGTRSEITALLSAAYGLSMTRIYVAVSD